MCDPVADCNSMARQAGSPGERPKSHATLSHTTESPFEGGGYLGSKEAAAMWMTKRLALLVVAGIIVGANCAVAGDGPAAPFLNGRRSQ